MDRPSMNERKLGADLILGGLLFGLLVFGVAGACMAVVFGATMTQEARPAPWWTLLVVLVPSLATWAGFVLVGRRRGWSL